MTTTTERYQVKETTTFGMLSGFRIWDNKEKTYLAYDFDEDEKYRADAKCELVNALNK